MVKSEVGKQSILYDNLTAVLYNNISKDLCASGLINLGDINNVLSNLHTTNLVSANVVDVYNYSNNQFTELDEIMATNDINADSEANSILALCNNIFLVEQYNKIREIDEGIILDNDKLKNRPYSKAALCFNSSLDGCDSLALDFNADVCITSILKPNVFSDNLWQEQLNRVNNVQLYNDTLGSYKVDE